jgi:hypothetical protein
MIEIISALYEEVKSLLFPNKEEKAKSANERPTVSSEFLLIIGGIITSATTAFIIYRISFHAHFDISSFMLWFIIPVGSGLCGFVAASGYYLASRITQRPATRRLALNMILVGASTYALIQYLNYHALVLDDGTKVSDIVPFWTYYQYAIESTKLQFRMRGTAIGSPTESLGSAGYIYEGIRFLGFLAGGLVCWKLLSNHPYCEECNKYYNKKAILSNVSLEKFNEFLSTCGLNFPGIIDKFTAIMSQKPVKGFKVSLFSCLTCDRKVFDFSIWTGRDTEFVAMYPYRGKFDQVKKQVIHTEAEEDTTSYTSELHSDTETDKKRSTFPHTVQCWKCRHFIDVTPEMKGKKSQMSSLSSKTSDAYITLSTFRNQ